uniref:Uncharacterized protein n=1 Tax=Pyrodinium bahamense TaxID=73915 RepID=A0A7S0A134_9DINO
MAATGQLALAAAAGNIGRVEQLVLKDGVDVNEQDDEGVTALMAAARAGQLKVVSRLLELRQPTLNATDAAGRTALDYAVEAGQEDVVSYMTRDTTLLPFARGLLPAIQRADVEVVQELLSATDERLRVDVNQCDARGAPALHCAVRVGSEAVLRALLGQPGLRVNAKDRYLRTALDAAYAQGHQELAFLLRSEGGRSGDDVEDE